MPVTPRVYIAVSSFAKQDPEPLNILKSSGLFFDVNRSGQRLNKTELINHARGFSGIIAGLESYDAEVLETLVDLKCISRCGAGTDNIDIKKTKEKNITVLNTPGVVVQPVAELTLGLMLDLLHRVTTHALLMRQKKWERHTGQLLSGKKVGIIGLGRIGLRVAEFLRAWGMEVNGVDIRPDEKWARQRGVKLMPLAQALADSDIISLHVSVDEGQPFCLCKKELALMKKGAFLINVARGSLVDEAELLKALQSGHLAGAGLDVFQQEPYTGPLCGLDNVILTPHVASLTQESRAAMEIGAAQNIVNFLINGESR
jgi:D-3-phosphoglycerate dehydrogenase